jgi:2Fe-2S ferredoxin
MSTVEFLPGARKVTARPHTNLLQLARQAKVSITTRCDGNAACMMCKVHIEDGAGLLPADAKEQNKLGDAMLAQGYRLACQARISGNGQPVVVSIPESPLKAAIRAQLAKQQEEDSLW